MRLKKWLMDPEVKKIALLTIAAKLLALIVVAIGAFFLPFNNANYFANFHFPPMDAPGFLNRFKTWDAQHYLYLANFGYQANFPSDAFYPLFPYLIRWVGFLFCDYHLLTALVLSTFFTVIGMIYLYKLVADLYDRTLAFQVCVLLLAFPMGFFLGFVYADSLFFMLATAFFYGWNKDEKGLVYGTVFLMPWTRPVGILMSVVILGALYLKENRAKLGMALGAVSANLFGFILYLLFMKRVTGDYWSGFLSQHYFQSGYSVLSFFHPVQWFEKNFIDLHWTWNGPLDGALSRIFLAVLIVLLFRGAQKIPLFLCLYVLVIGFASAFSGDLMSFPRYWLSLFPVFILLAMELKGVRWWVWVLCGLTQVVFTLLYSVNEWVA